MQSKLARIFIYSAASLLMVAGLAKVVSGAGTSGVLRTPDPILSIQLQTLLLLVGFLEIGIALLCFLGNRIDIKAASLAWLATDLSVYRLGLLWSHVEKPCSCLGTLTDALHIRAESADVVMKVVLIYILVGSYATMFWVWKGGFAHRARGAAPTR
jgi:hypothetical protein